jgi:hypothetical protein
MSFPTTGGWTCAQCGTFVGVNQSHTCRTVPETPNAPSVVYSIRPTRYRVHGRFIDRAPGGRKYDVDLTVEVTP